MLGNDLLVFFDDGFHKLYFCRLQSVVLDQAHRRYRKFGMCASLYNMDVDGKMLVRVELEDKSENDEYSGHIFLFVTAKIGNNFITIKFFILTDSAVSPGHRRVKAAPAWSVRCFVYVEDAVQVVAFVLKNDGGKALDALARVSERFA